MIYFIIIMFSLRSVERGREGEREGEGGERERGEVDVCVCVFCVCGRSVPWLESHIS